MSSCVKSFYEDLKVPEFFLCHFLIVELQFIFFHPPFLPRSHCSPQGRVFPAGGRGPDLQRAQERPGGDLLRVLLSLRARLGARVQHLSPQKLR